MKLILSVIFGIIGIITLWFAVRKLEYKEKLKILLGFLCIVIPLIINYIPSGNFQERVDINRAYLEPKLIIDEVTLKGLRFHFEIENTGIMPARALKFIFSGPKFSTTEMEKERGRDLAPRGGKISYTPIPLGGELEIDKENVQVFSLIATYYCLIDERKKEFISRFAFKLRPAQRRLQEHLYEFAERKEGLLADRDRFNVLNLHRLDSPKGSVAFRFVPNEQNADEVTNLIASKSKSLFYHSSEREIILRYKTLDEQNKVFRRKIANLNSDHFIVITWDERNVILYIDQERFPLKL